MTVDQAVILPSGRYAARRFLRGPEVISGSTIVVPAKPADPATSTPPAPPTADTVLVGVTCADLKAGVRVAVTFVPQADRALATEIRRQ